ncbi:M20 family metallopeptidase [Paucibacter sp. O1-1]|uniref:M20 aminoacylase family protein n=1 Tax=Paucibacter sp. XJ19-41 TaxID=2927824 RepID=UPI0010F6E9F0|nr:M20 aminoacylase family protein [Paucibacter sp. XJ19-41]MCU7373571.1 M20 family metallopeptidase [Paucibacter sp. O1-1]MDA3828572.1 M20 family metallopeptidase [Paucibacter sp. O1-1]MDC6166048.1 M20 family metallopeptidase [Paucibacter sp. XJ19-41]
MSGAYQRLSALHGELTALRRELHAMPELGFQETRTAARVVEALRLCGVDEIHTGIGRTGVVALIHGQGGAGGRLLGLRADMDALPLQEDNDFAWRSASPGLMHACGHDGHTTMLIGAARYLAQTRAFAGTAVLIFQPGEEGYAGAREMINDGLFERFPVESVYAMHNWPQMPAGHIGINRGAMMAAADQVEIVLTGRGGHGAHPHLAVDPVLMAGHVITAVQSLVSRNVAPLDQAVVSLCSLRAGEPGAFSVIPREARLTGTVRSFRPEVQLLIEQRLAELVQSLAQGFGGSASVSYQRLYPATINSAAEADFAADVAERLVGAARLNRELPPSMGSEDFSFMLQVKPGAYLRLGQARTEGENCGLHNPRYDFNDEVLPLGAALFAGLVEQGLPLSPSGVSTP